MILSKNKFDFLNPYTASILNCHGLVAFEGDLEAKFWTISICFSIMLRIFESGIYCEYSNLLQYIVGLLLKRI